MMNRLPSEFQFLVVTLILVLLLGAGTANSLMQDDYSQDSQLAAAAANEVNPTLSKGDRSPASLGSTIAPPKTSLSSLLSLDLSCSKKVAADFKISGQFVQFKGKNCLKGFKQEKIEIINQSNGSTASIFPYGQNLYQTDLIQLKAGVNEITIRHDAGGVKFEQKLKVSSTSI